MRYRHSLRYRIVLSYLIFGLAIGGLLAGFLLVSLRELEARLVIDHVNDEMRYFIDLTRRAPEVDTLRTEKLTGFKVARGEFVRGMEFLAPLAPGVHELRHAGREYTVSVADEGGFRFYMLYETTDLEVREYILAGILTAGIVLTVLFAAWFGYWLSGKLIAPVTQLAQEVESMPAARGAPQLSAEYANDEVGRLAKAFDGYMDRLERFIERERSFTMDASHELRTPLAVIQGAVEVLLARRDLSGQDRMRLERIERAARDMGQNLDALLILAREPGARTGLEGETDVTHAVDEAVEHHRTLIDTDKVAVQTQIAARPRVAAPATIVGILVGNLVRNAFRYTPQGTVRIRLDPDRLVIEDTGIGIGADELKRVFERGYRGRNTRGPGSGLGLSIVKRICDHYGWRVDIDSAKGRGTRVTWHFRPQPANASPEGADHTPVESRAG